MHGGKSEAKIPRTSKQRLAKKIFEVDHHHNQHHIEEENQVDDYNPISSNQDTTQQINLIKGNNPSSPSINPETFDQYDDNDIGLECDVVDEQCQRDSRLGFDNEEVIISLSDIDDFTGNQCNKPLLNLPSEINEIAETDDPALLSDNDDICSEDGGVSENETNLDSDNEQDEENYYA
eukprot:TCONS_00038779-protein